MDEVSDSSNTSAPETSAMGVRLASTGQLRLSSQQDPSNGTGLFDDRFLTGASADGGRALPLKGDGGVSVLALGAATPGATELRMAGDGVSSLGTAQDQVLTTTDSSASRLGDMFQSEPVAAPTFGDARASRHAPTSTSLADRTTAANDALDPPSTGPVNPSQQHADHPISPAHDVLPLDNILDPAPHRNSAADDHHHAPANDGAKPAHADALTIDDASKLSGHVNGNPNDAASSDAAGPASDGATIHQAQTTPPSTGALVEAGTKAILLATDESPNRIGPHASAADFTLGAGPGHVHSSAHASAAFSPGVIGARDQLASAIATATPEAAAMTTLPPLQMTGAAIPTLGGDMHALQKHAA